MKVRTAWPGFSRGSAGRIPSASSFDLVVVMALDELYRAVAREAEDAGGLGWVGLRLLRLRGLGLRELPRRGLDDLRVHVHLPIYADGPAGDAEVRVALAG